jgi:minor tail protein
VNIGSIFLTLLADGSKLGPQVEAEAQKAGDEGAKTLGQRLGGALKTEGVRVFGAVASAAFGIASKGALEMENAMARFRAETGATAEEAARVGRVVNKVAGDEQMALEAVTDIAVRVRRDLGAVGDEADALTADIAKFARVTRQDGAGAVEALDDIMDNWNLELKDAKGLMDRLVVSQRRWGGDLTKNQVTLAKLGPAMRAANFEIDDGIALLGLFGARGLDSERAAAAFSKALTKVESPEELQRLIDDIVATEDPFLRAQKAADLFGAKAGAQLANALEGANLDDYKVSVEEAAGAIDEAAEVIDNTISGRIRKAFSQAGATLRQFGSDLGPAATGLAGLATLFASFGGGKLLRGLASITLKPLAGLGVRIATFVATELGASKAASAIADGLGGSVGSAVNKLPGVAAVKAGASKLGTFLGTTAGKAFSLAFAAAAVIGAIDTYNRVKDELADQTKAIADNVQANLKTATDAQLEIQRQSLKTGMDQLAEQARAGNFLALDPLQEIVDQYNAVQTELNRRAAESAAVPAAELRAAQAETAQAARDLADEIPTAIEKNEARLRAAADAAIRKTVVGQLLHLGPDGIRAGAEASLGVAAGLRDKRDAIKAALDQLREDFKNKLGPTKEVALRIGQLFNRRLAKGLKDSDPVIKAQAEGTRALIEAQLIETVLAGGKAGEKIQRELEQKMKAKDPDVRRQAQRTKNLIDEALKKQPPKTPGDAIAQDLASDIRQGSGVVGRAAYDLGRTIARNLLAGVQGSAPVSGGGGGGGGGGGVPHQAVLAEGTGYVPFDQSAFIHRGEIVVPRESADAIRGGGAVLSASPANGPISVGPISVDARGATNPAAVGQAVADAVADALRTQTARLPVGTRS